MPFNPSGVFQRLYRWVTDRDNSIPIDSTRMDAEMDGMVTGINQIVNGTQAFTGTIKGPTGTSATPAFTFSNDPDTGMYRGLADTVGFSAGGAIVFTMGPTAVQAFQPLNMNSNQIIGLAAGSSAGHAVRYDQVMLLNGNNAMTNPLRVPAGSDTVPSLQFDNANNGLSWVTGTGPVFTAAGGAIARLTAGTSLATADAIVTRQAGDARYTQASRSIATGDGLTGGGNLSADRTLAVDATVLRTNAARTISAVLTFNADAMFQAASMRAVFSNDGARRVAITYRNNATDAVNQWINAGGDLEFTSPTSRNIIFSMGTIFRPSGDGVTVERHTDDGDGGGICVRSVTNPTTGMIFSVRSSGGALGLGVHQDKVTTSRGDMYVGTSGTGTGGNRVVHSGMTAGSVGELCFAKNKSGSTTGFGSTVAGSNLEPSSAAGTDITASLTGTWRCLGYAPNTGVTLFRRIS